jgi:hypothetical protein
MFAAKARDHGTVSFGQTAPNRWDCPGRMCRFCQGDAECVAAKSLLPGENVT